MDNSRPEQCSEDEDVNTVSFAVDIDSQDAPVSPNQQTDVNHEEECNCSVYDLPCIKETKDFIKQNITIPVCSCCIHNFIRELIEMSDCRIFMTDEAVDKLQVLYLELYAIWVECEKNHQSKAIRESWENAPANVRKLHRICYEHF
ncbi:unnamed protein product [Orchesella dallaii]|uniref:Uncharacterized protein n=1 Tax=Orchesella dallaii TaxID=48710 RepID=A0ABP1R2R3_9HEXA